MKWGSRSEPLVFEREIVEFLDRGVACTICSSVPREFTCCVLAFLTADLGKLTASRINTINALFVSREVPLSTDYTGIEHSEHPAD